MILMPENRNIAPMKLEVVVAIVHDNKKAYYSSLIQSRQANIRISVPCKGTSHYLFGYLGLDERPKTLIASVVREDQSQELIDILNENFQKGKDYKGVAFTIPFSSMIGTLAYGFLSNEKIVKEEA